MATPESESRRAKMKRDRWILAGVFVLLGGLGVLLLLPAVSTDGHRPPRMVCRNMLKQLGIAMFNYHDAYHCFPPAYIADKNGRPMHSWRVLLLPFTGVTRDHDTYAHYRFDEPWNGPHNRLLASAMPMLYHCPADTGPDTNTSYVAVVGPNTVFPGSGSVRIRQITDGLSVTIQLVEVADSGINWMEPRDLSYVEALRGINPKTGFGISSHHKGGAMVLFADGFAAFLPETIPTRDLRLLLDRNDGQSVDPRWVEY